MGCEGVKVRVDASKDIGNHTTVRLKLKAGKDCSKLRHNLEVINAQIKPLAESIDQKLNAKGIKTNLTYYERNGNFKFTSIKGWNINSTKLNLDEAKSLNNALASGNIDYVVNTIFPSLGFTRMQSQVNMVNESTEVMPSAKQLAIAIDRLVNLDPTKNGEIGTKWDNRNNKVYFNNIPGLTGYQGIRLDIEQSVSLLKSLSPNGVGNISLMCSALDEAQALLDAKK